MARRKNSMTLSPMNGGINRYEQQAKSNQTVDALDVYAPQGDLKRRPAFKAELIGNSYDIYNNVTFFYHDYAANGGAATTTFLTASLASTARFFVVFPEKCSGFYLSPSFHAFAAADVDANCFLRVRFVISDIDYEAASPALTKDGHDEDFSDFEWLYDETHVHTSTSTEYSCPLVKPGYIAWHEKDIPSDWSTTTITTIDGEGSPGNSNAGYIIAIDIVDRPQTGNSSFTYVNHPLYQDSDFDLNIYSLQKRGRVSFIQPMEVTDNALITAAKPTSFFTFPIKDKGAKVSRIAAPRRYSPLNLKLDYGTGVIDQYSDSVWTNRGTNNALERTNSDIEWLIADSLTEPLYLGQFGPAPLFVGLTPSAASGATFQSTDSILLTLPTGALNGYFVKETAVSSGSVNSVYYKIASFVNSTTFVSFQVAQVLSSPINPSTSTSFAIYGPSSFVQLQKPSIAQSVGDFDYYVKHRFPIEQVDDATTIEFQGKVANLTPLPGNTNDASGALTFSIEKESQQVLNENGCSDAAYNPFKQEWLFAGGESSLYAWDGQLLREYIAENDSTSIAVNNYSLNIQANLSLAQPGKIYYDDALYTNLPPVSFVRMFQGRIYAASSSTNEIFFSAPGDLNTVWPKKQTLAISDTSGSRIRGMEVLGDALYVYTDNSIYLVSAPDETGSSVVQNVSPGLGFISHRAVVKAPISGSTVLIGVNNDGVYAFTGAQPQVLLDEWDRVLDKPVSGAAMSRCVAEVSLFEECVYIAVPVGGASIPNRLIRWCWADQTMYVWTCPYGGVSAISADRRGGEEVLWFGHADGTISRLVDQETDDGETITGYARTPPINTGGTTVNVHGTMVTMKESGSSKNITQKLFLDRSSSAKQSYVTDFSGASVPLGTFELGTDYVSDKELVTKKLNAPSSSNTTTVQVEISGTHQWELRGLETLVRPKGRRVR